MGGQCGKVNWKILGTVFAAVAVLLLGANIAVYAQQSEEEEAKRYNIGIQNNKKIPLKKVEVENGLAKSFKSTETEISEVSPF